MAVNSTAVSHFAKTAATVTILVLCESASLSHELRIVAAAMADIYSILVLVQGLHLAFQHRDPLYTYLDTIWDFFSNLSNLS